MPKGFEFSSVQKQEITPPPDPQVLYWNLHQTHRQWCMVGMALTNIPPVCSSSEGNLQL